MSPVPIYSDPPPTQTDGAGFDPAEYRKARRPRYLLDQLTYVEEATIWQIEPLIHLTRIAHDSMRVKVNTSCVWQQSKLHLVLPTALPNSHYVYIVRDLHPSRPSLRSIRCRRYLIQEVLELSQQCDINGVWTVIAISQENLLMLMVDGDAMTLPNAPIVQEVNKNGGRP